MLELPGLQRTALLGHTSVSLPWHEAYAPAVQSMQSCCQLVVGWSGPAFAGRGTTVVVHVLLH